jgi:hypothetical protein
VRFVGDQRAHLRVVQQLQDALLDPQPSDSDTLGCTAFLMQPQAERVHRGDVRVARHGAQSTIAEDHHELL